MTGHVKAPAVAALAISTPSREPNRRVFQVDVGRSLTACMERAPSGEIAFPGIIFNDAEREETRKISKMSQR